MLKLTGLLIFSYCLATPAAWASPVFFTYTGRVAVDGVPSNGPVSMELRVTNGTSIACGANSAAGLYWTSGSTVVAVTSGFFTYKLGLQTDGVSQDLAFNDINWASTVTYHVDVCLSGNPGRLDTLPSSAYALYAGTAAYVPLADHALNANSAVAISSTVVMRFNGLTSDPLTASEGSIYYNTTTGTLRLKTGGNFVNITTGTGAGFCSNPVCGGVCCSEGQTCVSGACN